MINRPSRNQESSIAKTSKIQSSEEPPNHNIEDPDPSGINNQSQTASPSAHTPSPSGAQKIPIQRRQRSENMEY